MAFGYRFRLIVGIKSILTILLALSFVACSPVHRGPANRRLPSTTGPSGLTTSAAAFETTLYPIVQQACAQCHGAGQSPEFAVQDIQTGNDVLVQLDLVDFTDATASRIYQQANTDHQGVSTADPALAENIRLSIEAWAIAGGNTDGNVVVALEPTYESINNRIFVSRCNNCHSGAMPAGGLDLSDYNLAVAGGNNGGINNVTPEDTPIYARVNDDGEVLGAQMPQGGTPLTAEERAVILQWIQAGAPLN